MEVNAIVGHIEDDTFISRTLDEVEIAWGDVGKHRQALTTAAGRSLRLNLPRGSFLADGSVLYDDGTTMIVVRRPSEEAMVMDFADNHGPDAVRRALLLGYTLGNRHAPLDLDGHRVQTPLLTGSAAAEQTFHDLGLIGRVESVKLARQGWSNTSSDHHREHHHD